MAERGTTSVRQWFRQLRAAQWAFDDTFLVRFAEVWRADPIYVKYEPGGHFLPVAILTTADDPEGWSPLVGDFTVTVSPGKFFAFHRDVCAGHVKALPLVAPEPPAVDDYRSDERKFQLDVYWDMVRRGAIPRG